MLGFSLSYTYYATNDQDQDQDQDQDRLLYFDLPNKTEPQKYGLHFQPN